MPAALKRNVDEVVKEARVSGNVWAMRCIEQCLDKESDGRDELTFRGEGTFEIQLQGQPETRAVEDTIEVTLPVFAAGFPQHTAEMQMHLSVEQAEYMSAQLKAYSEAARNWRPA
jgi:hypothetical protein